MYQSIRRNRLNSNGYTLIEALFNLIVFILFVHLLISIYSWLNQMDDALTTNEHVAWELFVNDFEQYLLNVKQIELSSIIEDTIFISYVDSQEIVLVSRYEDIIRLQKSFEGYVPLLTGIKEFSFNLYGNYLTISVVFQSGLVKEREFFVQVFNG
ncbi:competence protein ComGF [Ureibacillus xyleni]|uniref:Competence protein ComGF n=1 Tax=Ureibacillus xyleni TaxID=614648 RepID=A0A285TTL0_9BACL|nr:competence type IV pilus minor pilin ComGF [Ureibacillus xyleni]SOC27379.1 competence protein ComGF [Ureibacillus xyleni]